jgi:hypothetical protein
MGYLKIRQLILLSHVLLYSILIDKHIAWQSQYLIKKFG